MTAEFPEYLFGAIVVLVPLLSVGNWWKSLSALRNGQPLIRRERWQPVPWGLLDLVLVVTLYAMLTGLGTMLAQACWDVSATTDASQLTLRDQAITFLQFGTATIVATFGSLVWLRARWPESRDLGFHRPPLYYDLVLGMKWFTMLAFPVLLMQLIATQWYPTKHPLIELMLKSQRGDFLIVAAFAAVVAAPFFEEAFFRLILQGWLEKLQSSFLLGSAFSQSESVLLGDRYPTEPDRATPHAKYPGIIGTSGASGTSDAAEIVSTDRVFWLPIVASATLFAVGHVGHGPDWLPLFFLALGLGYLYQRTRRIQPCIVVHMLINSVAIVQLWLAMREAA